MPLSNTELASLFQLDAITCTTISVFILGGNARIFFSDLLKLPDGENLAIPRSAMSLPIENLIAFKNDLVVLCATLEVTHAKQ
jgi:hypothetical protein